MAASLMFMGLDTSSRSLPQALDPEFFPSHNPVLRHRVLRRRQTLEEKEQPRLITDLRNHPRPRPKPLGTLLPGALPPGCGSETLPTLVRGCLKRAQL